ncbi:MAG: Asp-tRNA(Asn)/Glu-tRNA(Gln) amidotransferase subunit GatC [Pseudomonadota bacterium]
MALDRSDVEKVAHLARLAIDEDDIPEYTQNLSDILDMVAKMEAVDTEGVEPMAHPMEVTQRLRADTVTEVDRRETFQALAPAVEGGVYLVPRVVE